MPAYVVLGMEPRAVGMPGVLSPRRVHPWDLQEPVPQRYLSLMCYRTAG